MGLHISRALFAGGLCLFLLDEAAQAMTEQGGMLRAAWPLLLPFMSASGVLAIGYLRMRRLIVQRTKAEAKLGHELALRKALLACLPEPVAAKDPSLRYIELNPAFEHFFGIAKADAVGRHALEVERLRERMTGDLLALQDEAIRTMAPRQTRLHMRNAAGQLRRVNFWALPFRNPDGMPGGIVTVHFDVTDIDESRERAQAFERRLKDVVDSLPVTVFQSRLPSDACDLGWEVTYAAGDGVGRGVDTVTALGAGPSESTGFCPQDRQRLRAAILESARTCQPLDVEGRLNCGPEPRWIRARAMPRREGNCTVWNGVVIDVTDVHRQAEALHEAKDAAEADLRAKEGFLAMMSHEIRTPMNGILGLVELLQNTALTPAQHRMLTLAQESGHALAQILDDILDYARIEAGRLAIVPAPVDLRDLLDSVSSLLLPQAQQKGLQLRVQVSAEVPAIVRADSIRMRQILFNLLGNAIKFTDRGSVTLRATVEAFTQETATVLLEVQDTGIGIASADMPRLFTPFVQGARSSARRIGGTGLGLAISRNLAAMMGGSLVLSSEEGMGTTAALRVPCSVMRQASEPPMHKRQQQATCAVEPDVPPAPARWRILVAEDHCINQEVIRQQLVLLGHTPTVVDNGQAALDALSAGAFDLLLTDFHLPRMDGFALTQALRTSADATLRVLPVVGITATTVPEEHRRGFEAGMNACVLKPVTLASLQQGLESAMRADGAATVPIGACRPQSGAAGALRFDATLARREDLLAVLVEGSGSGDAGLQACIAALQADRDALLDGLATRATAALRAWCHRMRGALSVFGQPHLDDIIDSLQRAVESGNGDSVRAAARPVLDVIAYLMKALAPDSRDAGELARAPVNCRDCTLPRAECAAGNPHGGHESGEGKSNGNQGNTCG
ncbi:ATP-binding protein [Cupriavidus numazuensis]|uniref:histidine kinase n=1 Tax=Cupriavidus numazuensis TaxID=221992 RepID=A0ABN7Q9R3_9BURK|nr:ATP-binding protein [Cupriavidus numazuensis]CAG2158958.1 Sensor histidine kinase RcsC [Cupriavidus numazuensis]